MYLSGLPERSIPSNSNFLTFFKLNKKFYIIRKLFALLQYIYLFILTTFYVWKNIITKFEIIAKKQPTRPVNGPAEPADGLLVCGLLGRHRRGCIRLVLGRPLTTRHVPTARINAHSFLLMAHGLWPMMHALSNWVRKNLTRFDP
jgi:hypothetical protein